MCGCFLWGGFLSGRPKKTENWVLDRFAQGRIVKKWEKASSQIRAVDLRTWTLTSLPPCLKVTSQPQWSSCIQTVFNSPGLNYLVPLVHEDALTCPTVCPIFLQFWRSEIQNASPWDKIKVWQGCVPSEVSREEPVSSPFPAFGTYPHSLAHDHLPSWKKSNYNLPDLLPL